MKEDNEMLDELVYDFNSDEEWNNIIYWLNKFKLLLNKNILINYIFIIYDVGWNLMVLWKSTIELFFDDIIFMSNDLPSKIIRFLQIKEEK